MVNDPKKTLSPLLPGKYVILRKHSTQRRHQVNDGNSGLEDDQVQALGALRSMRSTKMFDAGKRCEMHFLCNEENEKWIEDYVDRVSAVARKRVEDAETAIKQEVLE